MMKKLLKKLTAFLMSGLITASVAVVPATVTAVEDINTNARYVEGEAVVVLNNSANSNYTKQQKAALVYGKGVKIKDTYSFNKKSGDIRVAVLKSSTLSTKQMVSSLKKDSKIKYAFPNFIMKATSITDDEYSDYQWALDNKGQQNGTKGIDVNAEALWTKASESKDEKVVAIIDTGIDYNSEEFKDVLWKNPYGNKLVGKFGADFTGMIEDGTPLDDNGHGSHVAGIIAGKSDNKTGISGINKSNVKIMALKMLDCDGNGSFDSEMACFEYVERALELGTKISAINCSFGGYGNEESKAFLDEMFNYFGSKGVITCVAAGNESTDLNEQNDPDSGFYQENGIILPACSDSPYCITVGASNENGDCADFSNYGDKYVDVAAPGADILSTVSYNCFNPSVYSLSDRERLCAYYQNFDGEFKESDFGYPNILTNIDAMPDLSQTLKFEKSDNFFGLSGKGLSFSTEEQKEYESTNYAFEIPFTLEDENKDYNISFMCSSPSETEGFVFDVPADCDISTKVDIPEFEYNSFHLQGGNYWSHQTYEIDTSFSSYDKSKDRKLVFVVSASEDFIIDDLAISSQNVSPDDFGKYNFYSGTSMACPYVTGAVALVENAYPDASISRVINIIKNSGRSIPGLKGKFKSGKTLSLDNVDKLPPMIVGAEYNADGNVEITGVFDDVGSVYVDGKKADIISENSEKLVIKDNGYSTYNVKIKVENAYGIDELEALLVNKKSVEKTTKVSGSPEDTSTAMMVPAENKAYLIDTFNGKIGVLNTNSPKKSYSFTDERYEIDLKSIFNSENYVIQSAVYYKSKIYFTAVNYISYNNKFIIGYDTVFGYYDLNRERTEKFCEIPDECFEGSTLALLNDNIYLMGGLDVKELTFTDSVYKFNFTDNAFEKTEYNLPQKRAYTSFIQYNDKLIGMYGAEESGEMPPEIVFDGSKWKTSSLKLDSTDFYNHKILSDQSVNVFAGNVGIDKDGVFCNGAFVSGLGDTFTYDVENDKIIENEYCYRKNLNDAMLVGTTVSGAFIGFNIIDIKEDEPSEEYNMFNSDSFFNNTSSQETQTVNTYLIELDNISHYQPVEPQPVPEPVSPKLSATSVSLKAGGVKKLTVTGETVTAWSSSKKSVATVNKGKITALNKGNTTVTAKLKSGKKLSCKVTVTSAPKIKVNGKKFSKSKQYSVEKNKSLKITVSGKAPSVNNVYKTSNKKVAKITSKASAKTVKIKGIKKGKAKITLKVNGVAFKIKVKVK